MLSLKLASPPPPQQCFLIYAKPFTCHTERRNSKSEDREAAVIAEERTRDSKNNRKHRKV